MTYMKLLQAGTERISLTKRKRAYALLSALTEFTWTSKVYVNGALAGEWKYGYSAFMFDITDPC